MAHESEGPSPDEVRRYINSLYDRAESDTGRFNPTRAASIPRQRSAAPRGRSQEDSEPAVETFARKWFGAARAKLGPTVPATLPERRSPVRSGRAPEPARPARPVERPAEPLALEAPKAPAGAARELTGGTAPAPTTGILPEIPAQRVAPALPGGSRPDESAPREGAPPLVGAEAAAWPLPEPEPAPALAQADLQAYGTALPDVPAPAPAPALATPAPVAPALAAPAPVVPPEPAAAPAPSTTAFSTTAFTPAASGGSWLSPDTGHRTRAERVVAFARAQIGRPCVWGAVGPGSYDAPGLTQAAWKAAGVTLPRTTQAQWEAGPRVPLADVQVGDLVFFHDDLGHVGIWSGDGMMIHAPGPGALIREESVFFAGQTAIKGAVRPA
ncbi:NlpC/P60 family protein [Streptomyces sp. Go-475]|uniref:C40 family peptidase n=1 Tax=Streptomyces sp. Go-475 TaxID=2072505 RepID=UPI000DF070B0|nr:NlpC/P60 family protein [Streptomyces sp. Go-475]AXE87522.1 putative endopeptidase precursor [Streptomyces sp. Go-475]